MIFKRYCIFISCIVSDPDPVPPQEVHHSLRQALHRQHPLRVGRGPSGGRQIRPARITAPTLTKQLFKVGQLNKSP